MDKTIFKKASVLFSGSVLSIIIGLITTPIITRLVTPSEYGQLSFFNMYSNVAYLMCMIGLDQALVKYFYECEEDKRKKLLKDCVKISVLSVILFVTILFLFKFRKSGNKITLILFIINVFFLVIHRYAMLIIRMQQKVKIYSLLNILDKIIYVFLAIFSIKYTNINPLLSLMLAVTIAKITVAIVAISLENKWWGAEKQKVQSPIKMKELILYGYPYIFTFIINWMFQSADKMSIKYFGSFEEVGIYAGAMNIISLFMLIQTTFNTLWVPIAFEHYNTKKEDRKFFEYVNVFITILMFTMGISIILLKDLFILILGEEYRLATYVIPFLIFSPIMSTISETTVHGINFSGKTKCHIYISFFSCICNIIGNLILVPAYGPRGAAISTGISYILFFILRTKISNKYYQVNYNMRKIYILTFVTIIYAILNTFLDYWMLNVLSYCIVITLIIILYKRYIKYFWEIFIEEVIKIK